MESRELTKFIYSYISKKLIDDKATCGCNEIYTAVQGVSPSTTMELVVGSVKSMEHHFVVKCEIVTKNFLEITTDGEECIKEQGTPEKRILTFLKNYKDGLKRSEIISNSGMSENLITTGINALMRRRALTIIKADKKDTNPLIKIADGFDVDGFVDNDFNLIKDFINGKELAGPDQKNLLTRKFIQKAQSKELIVSRGTDFANGVEREIVPDLTREMVLAIQEGRANPNLEVKALNLKGVLGAVPSFGTLHPLLQVRRSFVDIFISMGFEQMPTDRWVESSFWCFDSLYQPQQHPARDAQDTFFISGDYAKANLNALPEGYLEKVKNMHEHGGCGSTGWKYVFSIDETAKNIMRTHTTATSARMLYQISQEYKKTGIFRPRRLFSIDRVFRNETPDQTHLCEFHQVEGLICDYGLNLGNLMATIREFFTKLNMGSDITFKPCFNPYTEPSMEIFGFHPGLNKYVELGNSGMFRPEMLRPMGLPEGVTVIAWGLSLERPTMIKYKLQNIRDLIGPATDCNLLQNYKFFLPDEHI